MASFALHKRGWLVLCALVLAGCGTGRTTEQVEGVVTLDGTPLADIRVAFQPQGAGSRDAGMGSHGTTDASGHFVLRLADTDELGAMVGTHRVTLSDKHTEDDSDAGESKAPKSRIPAKYLEDRLTFEVKSGQKNDAQFQLSSK